MPTIFEKIEEGLKNSDLPSQIAAQVAGLSTVGTSLGQLINTPPAEIGDLIQNLQKISLPKTNVVGNLSQAITSLGDKVPQNLDGLTGSLSSDITALVQTISADVIGRLTPHIGAYQAVHSLLQVGGGAGNNDGLKTPESVTTAGLFGRDASFSGFRAFAAEPIMGFAASGSTEPIDQISEALNSLPSPLNVENFLQFILHVLEEFPRSRIAARQFPFVDEARQTLETLLEWRTLNGNQIAARIETTLRSTASFISQNIEGGIQPAVEKINTLSNQLDTVALKILVDGLSQKIRDLGAAVINADLAAINASVTTLNDMVSQLALILSAIEANYFNGQTESLVETLRGIPADLHARICLLLSTLNPPTDLSLVNSIAETLNQTFDSAQVDEFTAAINSFLNRIGDILDKIDFSKIEEPIKTATASVQSAVDELDGILIEIVAKVSLLFDEVEGIVNQVDTEAIKNVIQTALDDFQQILQQEIDDLFAPIRDAIQTAVDGISAATDEFQPESLTGALNAAIQTLGNILSTPEITDTLNKVKKTLETISDELNSISFKPVNDLVITQIEGVTATLRKIDPDALNTALKLALKAALEILPDEEFINALKKRLGSEFNEFIETGPIPLLEKVKEQPARLQQQVKGFAPANLIGDQLSKPFQALLKELQSFQPSKLFEPVQAALNGVKTNLQKNANPGQFIAPLEKPYSDLIEAFDRLKPQELIAPLQEQIDAAIETVLDALHLDQFFEILDSILQKVQNIIDTLEAFRNVLQKVSEMLGQLTAPDNQVQEWIDGVLNRLDEVPDTVDLAPAFDEIRVAIGEIKSAPLRNSILAPLESFIQRLTDLQPQKSLAQVIRDYRDFPRAAIASLPAPEKQRVESFLADFRPLDRSVSHPFNGLQEFLESIRDQPQAVTGFFADWDSRYHGSNSPFNKCLPADRSVAAVKNIIREELNQKVGAPLTSAAHAASKLRELLDAFRATFGQFLDDLKAKFALLLNGPGSLGGIRDAANAMIDKIRSFNLNFLVDETEELFNKIKGKLAVISPAALRAVAEAAFNEILAKLDVSILLPAAQIAQLDGVYKAVISKIKALDPGESLVKKIQPEFEKTVQPYLEAFDLTEFFQTIIEVLERLKEELPTELDRTGQAWRAMLDAAPSIEIGLSVDLGVSPF